MSIPRKVNDLGLYTLAQAATMIGRHPDTVRQWIRQGKAPRAQTMAFGELEMPVYSLEDIAVLQEVADSIRHGRPPVGLLPAMRDARTLNLVDIESYRKGKK